MTVTESGSVSETESVTVSVSAAEFLQDPGRRIPELASASVTATVSVSESVTAAESVPDPGCPTPVLLPH